MDKPQIFILNWTGRQTSQTPAEARVPKENRNHSSKDLNIFFSKITDNAHETTHSLSRYSICADISAEIPGAMLSIMPLSDVEVYTTCIQQNWDIQALNVISSRCKWLAWCNKTLSRNQSEVEKMSLAKCQLYNHNEQFLSALSAAKPSLHQK